MSTNLTKKESTFASEEDLVPTDRQREAENMQELLSRQSKSFGLLTISSKQALAVIKQF